MFSSSAMFLGEIARLLPTITGFLNSGIFSCFLKGWISAAKSKRDRVSVAVFLCTDIWSDIIFRNSPIKLHAKIVTIVCNEEHEDISIKSEMNKGFTLSPAPLKEKQDK